ncbi:DUF222 domain-containing protein [Candidatus Poriferisodalis sp.]|uniref:HNH endonuclease n=1 Tax=Candidatus Poriferisodalis sp. TaxID=3101277 RepID=UPI003D0A6D1A
MKRSDVRTDSAAGMPTGSMPASDAAVAAPPALSSPAGPVSLRVEPVEAASIAVPPVGPVSLRVEPVEAVSLAVPPVGPVLLVEGVLSVLCGARDIVARASRVPLGDAGCDTLADVIDVASRLRSATDAVVLSATAALEAARAGSGRTALVGRARLSKRNAKRTVEASEQVARMPNVARGLAAGELNVEHAQVLADAARRTSADAVDSAAELLEAAAQVSPETLRDQARRFAARHDPDAAECELGRQRRARCASLFVDESTGMGVLHAEFDPVSFTFVRQALENYNDALWRLDGGRDGTPGQIRDNRQRLADSLFEMVTDRNALATIDHPAAHNPDTDRRPRTNDSHDRRSDAAQGRDSDAGHGGHCDAGHGGHCDAEHDGHCDAAHGRDSDAGHGGHCDAGHGGHCDAEHDGHCDTGHGGHCDAEHDGRSDHGHGRNAHAHDRTERPRDGGAGDARLGSGGDGASHSPAGRSIDRWRPAQAPNQLIIIAETGVIDGTKPHGLCELLGTGPVPPAILDNLSPDTRIRGALFDTNGEILWLGRSHRHANAAQHLAIAIRDRGCVLCRAPMHRCHDHHINEWAADNGTTDIPNLAALCNDCHAKLHNNNERLERRTAPRRWTTTPRTNTTGQTNDTTPTAPP